MEARQAIKVMIAGGGTGGHLYPALALAQEFEKQWQAQIMFIGTSYGIENKVLPKTSYLFKKIWVRGLERKLSPGNLLFPFRLLASLVQCAYFMATFRPNLVVGTGGYVSGPALMLGIAARIPTVIQEQNSFPGLVNRLLARWARQVHVTYESSVRYLKGAQNVFVSGNPVRGALNKIDRTEALQTFGLSESRTTLFVFGGSQGARAINNALMKSLPGLRSLENLQILWATGPAHFDKVVSHFEDPGESLRIYPFIDDMAAAYSAADVVLCRAGASTLSEIATCGLPAILIPFPYAAAGHQESNARALELAGAAVTLLESSLSEHTLVKAVKEMAENLEKRKAMSEAALKFARPEAARDIVRKIEELIYPRNLK